MQERCPIVYLPHGGGPMPLLGDPSQAGLANFLRELGRQLPLPRAILMVSAHWISAEPAVMGAEQPGLLYDYYGFPPEAYRITYPAAGSPELAAKVLSLLQQAGLSPRNELERGFDHGMFVPLKLMLPDASIPCVQLALLKSFDPAAHIGMGEAVAALREEGVLIVGSGMSFHNMRAFFEPQAVQPSPESVAFDLWLEETCCGSTLSADERQQRLVAWQQAPYGRYCHPYEDHLLPLMVCLGAALRAGSQAELIYRQPFMGHQVNALLWR